MITASAILLVTAAALWYFWDFEGWRTIIANAVPATQVLVAQLVDAFSGFNLWGDIMSPSAAALTILGLTALNVFMRFRTESPVGG